MRKIFAMLVSVSMISTALVPAATVYAQVKPTYGSFGFDVAGMDRSVLPGDDFYAHANGTWARTTQIPADKSNFGMFSVLDDLSKKRTRDLLEAAKANPASKVGRAYSSYLNNKLVESKGLAPISPWLNQIRALKSKSGFAALAAKADRMSIGTPFGTYIGQDDKNPDAYILTMYQAGIGMPERDYFLENNERFTKIRGAYVKYLTHMLTIAGESNAASRAQAVFDFEKAVATAHWNKLDSSNATKTYNKYTLAKLQSDAPGFDFKTFFNGLGIKTDDLLVSQPSAIVGTAALVSKTDLQVLKDKLIISSLNTYSGALPDRVANTSFAFYGTALSGTPQQEPRWKRAVNFVTATMSDELGKTYVQKYFPPATKAAAQQLVKNVVAAMGRRIEGLDWMKPETKVKAKKKLANFTTKIGYPDKWRDYSALKVDANDLFGNAVRAAEFQHVDQVSKLGGPIRRWEWGMTPMTINAYANFSMNEIVFPAAILQPPFFDPAADPALNYGGIGAVIGHEISHHFDDEGAKYDENGKLADWWTEDDVAAFKAASKKLIDQYDVYEPLPGQKINGEFTLGENIGDLAGLSVAYDAYRASLNGQEAPMILGTSGAQRFFLGWAQVWRRNYREANLAQRLTTDPHSPSIQRVWVVRNIDAFYDAYQPKPGQKLYLKPEDRVRIW